jgi:exopolysaccharide production protein ExoZ
MDLIFNPLHLEFLMGMGAGWLYEKRKIPPLWISIALVGLCLWLLVTRGGGHRALVCGGIGFGLVLVALAVEPKLGALGRYGAVLGDASYDLYLIHLPLVVTMARMRGRFGLRSDYLGLVVSLVFAQAVSLMCWKFFDQPLQKRLNSMLLG